MTTIGWNYRIYDTAGNIIAWDFGFKNEQDAEKAAITYIEKNGLADYTLDVSTPAN